MVLRSNLLKKWIGIIFSLKFLVQMQPKLMSCFMSKLEKRRNFYSLAFFIVKDWPVRMILILKYWPEYRRLLVVQSISWFHNIAGPIPKEIGHLHKLEEFQLESNSLIKGSIPKEIGNMTALTHLYLHDMNLSGMHFLFHLFNYHNLRVALIHLIVCVLSHSVSHLSCHSSQLPIPWALNIS